MDTQIVLVFCMCDDLLKGLHHVEDQQRQMKDAEVLSGKVNSDKKRGEVKVVNLERNE